jgi:hypothetical protein
MREQRRIGPAMQQRMIAAQARGLDVARSMMDAAAKQADIGPAAPDIGGARSRAGKAQAGMRDRWTILWSGTR